MPGALANRRASSKNQTVLTIQNRSVSVSSLDKVFYPETGFTKGQ